VQLMRRLVAVAVAVIDGGGGGFTTNPNPTFEGRDLPRAWEY